MKIYNIDCIKKYLIIHEGIYGPRPNGFIVYPNDGPNSLYDTFFIPETPHWFKILKVQCPLPPVIITA